MLPHGPFLYAMRLLCRTEARHSRAMPRTNHVIKQLNREVRRRIRVVGAFPDGNSALILVCARLRHMACTQWGDKKYIKAKCDLLFRTANLITR